VVVDNASSDGTVEAVRELFPNVRLVPRSSNGGYAVAVNQGARLVPTDDVLVLNPDVVVRPESATVLEEYLAANSRVGIVVPTLLNPDGSIQASVRTFPNPLTMLARRSPFGRTGPGREILARHIGDQLDRTRSRPIDWALGAAMLVRRDVFDRVGGMDERLFLYGEDVDWCYRAWQGGWEVHLEPAAVMDHAYERSSRRTLDIRSAATRHHWASVAKLFALHPGLLIGRRPGSAP
jgi:GT2 family glycosyltransferase